MVVAFPCRVAMRGRDCRRSVAATMVRGARRGGAAVLAAVAVLVGLFVAAVSGPPAFLRLAGRAVAPARHRAALHAASPGRGGLLPSAEALAPGDSSGHWWPTSGGAVALVLSVLLATAAPQPSLAQSAAGQVN